MDQFLDAAGQPWEVIDFKTDVLRGKKRRVLIGDWEADGRAFVPIGRTEDVRCFEFGKVAYRDTAPRTLAEQFRLAKPASANAAQRMQRNG